MPRDNRIWMTFPVNVWMHPRVRPLPDAAFRLWVSAIGWSAEHDNDGWSSRTNRIAIGGSKRAADRLVGAGLWLADHVDGETGHWIVRNELWSIYRASTYRERVPALLRAAVLNRDGHRCLECGTGGDLQMDHIYPWSRGGTTTYDNLQTLCGPCNRTKGARV